MSFHSQLTSTDLHETKVNTQATGADPVSTPGFIGKEVFDTVSMKRFVGKGTSSSDDWKTQYGGFDWVVGPASDSRSTHTTLAAALADSLVVSGHRILVVADQAVSTAVNITKANLHIVFAPGVTMNADTTGGAFSAFTVNANGVIIENARFARTAGGNALTALNIPSAGISYCKFLFPVFATTVGTQYLDQSTNQNNLLLGEISE